MGRWFAAQSRKTDPSLDNKRDIQGLSSAAIRFDAAKLSLMIDTTHIFQITFIFLRYTDLGATEAAQTSQVTYVSGA